MDKYIILPIQMSRLIYSIYKFSNIDPFTGEKSAEHSFKMFSKLKEDMNFIYLSDSSKIDKKNSILMTQYEKIMIEQIY